MGQREAAAHQARGPSRAVGSAGRPDPALPAWALGPQCRCPVPAVSGAHVPADTTRCPPQPASAPYWGGQNLPHSTTCGGKDKG